MRRGREQSATFKRTTIHCGYNRNWLGPITAKMAENLTSVRTWGSLHVQCNTLARWHAHKHQDSSKNDHEGQKVGSGPIPGNPCPIPQIAGLILPLTSLRNYPANKKNIFQGALSFHTTPFPGVCSDLSRPHSVYGMCISLNKSASQLSSWRRALLPAHLYPSQASCINKSASYLSLCLLLNSFCADT